MKQARITAGMVAIVIILWVIYEKYELSKEIECTPSENQKMIMESFDELKQGNDYISDLLNNK